MASLMFSTFSSSLTIMAQSRFSFFRLPLLLCPSPSTDSSCSSADTLSSVLLLCLANRVLGTSFGNHLGDWEHTMIRFQDGNPIAIYLSQHNSGTAYEWDAIMKMPDGNRPTIYVGLGDHACYAMVRYIRLRILTGAQTSSSRTLFNIARYASVRRFLDGSNGRWHDVGHFLKLQRVSLRFKQWAIHIPQFQLYPIICRQRQQ